MATINESSIYLTQRMACDPPTQLFILLDVLVFIYLTVPPLSIYGRVCTFEYSSLQVGIIEIQRKEKGMCLLSSRVSS